MGVFVRHTETVSNNGIFKFNDVQVNIGDGYDQFTGYFTAPVNGMYYFSINISKDKNTISWYNVNFRKKNKSDYDILTSAHSGGSSEVNGYENMAVSTLVELKQGDQLYVHF